MAQITITINTNNQAFEEDELGEINRILNTIVPSIELEDNFKLRDINGNVVGEVNYVEDFDDTDYNF